MGNYRPLPTKCWEAFLKYKGLCIAEPIAVTTNGKNQVNVQFLSGEIKNRFLPFILGLPVKLLDAQLKNSMHGQKKIANNITASSNSFCFHLRNLPDKKYSLQKK